MSMRADPVNALLYPKTTRLEGLTESTLNISGKSGLPSRNRMLLAHEVDPSKIPQLSISCTQSTYVDAGINRSVFEAGDQPR